MTTAEALIGHGERPRTARWIVAALIAVAAHAGLVAGALRLRSPEPPGASPEPVVILELAPLPVAPASPVDAAPGPPMQEAPPPEPAVQSQPVTEPPAEPLPALPSPEVVAPPPQPLPRPEAAPKPPEPPKAEPQRRPVERTTPAPRSTAAPRSKRHTAERPAAPSPGAAAARAALADWRSQVMARLQRAKRYPRGAERRREQGVVTLAFSLSRSGHVLSRHIARSSGSVELDKEALAMVARAAPFPPFPASMPQSSVRLTVPIRFALR